MPCDPALLPALGRVTWAAVRLQHGVRDALRHIAVHAGVPPTDTAFAASLGGAIEALEHEAGHLPSPAGPALLVWCRDQGRPATARRNGVVHAVSYTADDGHQAIGGFPVGPDRPARYLEHELLDVAGRLAHASATLPSGPY